MTVSDEVAWLVISAWFYYHLSINDICLLFNISRSTIKRFLASWKVNGFPIPIKRARKRRQDLVRDSRLIACIKRIYTETPSIYLDEMQKRVETEDGRKISYTTVLRVLKLDLKYTRRVMEKAARYASFKAQLDYLSTLSAIYSNSNQLVFVDEASRDARSTFRKRGYGPKGEKLISKTPFERGHRVSVLAASDLSGFMGWALTMGTYDSATFFEHFRQQILPLLNPWPLPRSIVILDNAAIHRRDVVDLVHSVGAHIIFLPPYSPYLNPIETAFGLFKAFLQRYCWKLYRSRPLDCINIALECCHDTLEALNNGIVMGVNCDLQSTFDHAGYNRHSIDFNMLAYHNPLGFLQIMNELMGEDFIDPESDEDDDDDVDEIAAQEAAQAQEDMELDG